MVQDSAIEWTHHTFNGWHGCTRISEGCNNCYAEAFDKRVGGNHWGAGVPRRVFGDAHWKEPLKWDKAAEKAGERHRVFCSSMADVFDHEAPEGQRERLWALIQQTPHLDWLLLTKRIEAAAGYLPWYQDGKQVADPWPNVWLGATAENQKRLDHRAPVLLTTAARIKFLSCEPLLGPLNLQPHGFTPDHHSRNALMARNGRWGTCGACPRDSQGMPYPERCEYTDRYDHRLSMISWVIAGGESGSGARPMHPDWARELRDQCVGAGVPFLFKQWGQWSEIPFDDDNPPGDKAGECYWNYAGGHGFHGERLVRLKRADKKKNGRLLDGRLWDEYPNTGL